MGSGKNVVGHFGGGESGLPGVTTDRWEVFTGDVVLSAEGVRPRGGKIVLWFEDKPLPSGCAVYRAWYPADKMLKNLTRYLVEKEGSYCGWIGRDIHFLTAGVHDGKTMSWVCTHRDDRDIEENWQFPGERDEVVELFEGWDPVVLELVKATPLGRLMIISWFFEIGCLGLSVRGWMGREG